jgi:hypothetical protein
MSTAPVNNFDASRGENESKVFQRDAAPYIFRPRAQIACLTQHERADIY